VLTKRVHLLLKCIMKTSFGSWDCWDIQHPKYYKQLCFFNVGLRFALRGVEEQHDLLRDQFVRVPTDISIYNQQVSIKLQLQIRKELVILL